MNQISHFLVLSWYSLKFDRPHSTGLRLYESYEYFELLTVSTLLQGVLFEITSVHQSL